MRRIPRSAHLCGLLLALTVAICVALGLAGRITGPATEVALPPALRCDCNVRYRDDLVSRKPYLDLVYHAENPARGRPAIVFVHGGGWSAGDKHFYRPTLVRWAGRGYVAVAVNYRLTGEAVYPAALEDVKASIRWLRAHAEEYGIAPGRVGIAGVSAGAHLAALAGVVQPGDGLEGDGPYPEQSSAVSCVVARSGVYDLRPEALGRSGSRDLAVRGLLGGRADRKPELARSASPVAFLDPADPPMLVIHGTADRRIPVAAAHHMAEALTQAGVAHELLLVEEGNHGGAPTPERERAVQEAMGRFLAAHLGPPEP